jgi:hypothetical protein
MEFGPTNGDPTEPREDGDEAHPRGWTVFQRLADDCNRAAEFYENKPGLVQPSTVVDLYRTIAVLATAMDVETESGDE